MAENPPTEEITAAETAGGSLRRPLVAFCLSAVAGWLFGFYFLPPSLPLLALATPCVLASLFFSNSRWTSPALHLGAAMIAAAHAVLTAEPPAENFLPRLLERARESVEIVGTISEEPVLRDGTQWIIPLDVEGLRQTVEWQRATGVLEVRWQVKDAGAAMPEYGQRWHFYGMIAQRQARGNEPTVMMRARGEGTLLGEGPHSRFYSWCLAQRKKASAVLGTGIRESDFPQELAMMRALVLGERTEIDPHVRRAFARTGTLHIVAISGSHVAVFFGLIAAVLRATGVPRISWTLFATPVLVVYTTMAGLPSSAVRSCLMAIVFTSAPLFRRKTDGPTALAISALLVLAVVPRDLFDAGFLLSFLVVGGLMIFYRPIFRWLLRWTPEEPWQHEISFASRIWRWILREVASLFAASLAAWLVSEPLTAIFFNLRSPVALLANLAVVPLAFLILFSGCMSLVAGFLTGWFWSLPVEMFNHADRVFVHAMLWIVETSCGMRGAYQFVRSPPVFWVLVYYVLLTALFFARGRLRAAASIIASVLLAFWCGDYFFTRRVTAEWLRVGATPVLFLDLPRDQDVLVDVGESHYSQQLIRFLHERGVDHLRALVLTRPAAESLGGAELLLAEIAVDEVWISSWRGRSKVADEFAQYCELMDVPARTLKRGDGGELSGGVRWEAVHPQAENKYRSASEGGVILRFTRGPASIAFAGGGGPECEREVASWARDVDADVLLAGAKTKEEWGAGFVNSFHPRTIVMPKPVTVGEEAADRAAPRGSVGVERFLVPRDQLWTMVFPDEKKFQGLEILESVFSNDWNLRTNAWWRGRTVPLEQ